MTLGQSCAYNGVVLTILIFEILPESVLWAVTGLLGNTKHVKELLDWMEEEMEEVLTDAELSA